jgi:hypothetical protein
VVEMVTRNVKKILSVWLMHSAATVDFSIGNALQILDDFIEAMGGDSDEECKQLKVLL